MSSSQKAKIQGLNDLWICLIFVLSTIYTRHINGKALHRMCVSLCTKIILLWWDNLETKIRFPFPVQLMAVVYVSQVIKFHIPIIIFYKARKKLTFEV